MKHRAEILAACSWLAGYGLVTWAVVAASGADWAAFIWRLALGMLLLALPGIRLLWVVLRDGLYTLTRDDRR